jgi:hypothetical protein
MKNFNKQLIWILFLIIGFSVNGCYHNHINQWAKYNGGIYLPDSQYVVFRNIKFFRKAKGLTAFPDGGISKTLYTNTSLYRVDLDAGCAYRLHDFSETEEYFHFPGAHISYRDSFLLYSSSAYSDGPYYGIYLLNLRNNFRQRVSDKGGRAVLSTDAKKIAYLYKGHVFIYDIKTEGLTAIRFPKNSEAVYIKYFGDTLCLFTNREGNWRYDREEQGFVSTDIGKREKNYGQDPIPYKRLKAIPDSVWGVYSDNNKLVFPEYLKQN